MTRKEWIEAYKQDKKVNKKKLVFISARDQVLIAAEMSINGGNIKDLVDKAIGIAYGDENG